ncbi:CCA tRNA nucleotidyltransferase 1, mitochondrial-like [Prorops nasuta]|uniref:CCA tRNA nucleotidyltransferase 1, mitochondrial-like n=1 Tax=Prorops nasuta TaxID=863751 RepID=UPI0034CF6AEE
MIQPRENPIIMKLNKSMFEYLRKPGFNRLVNIFDQYNFKLIIAGGAVRDLLLKLKPEDVDFATDATVDEMKAMFSRNEWIELLERRGEEHGTVTAKMNPSEIYAITTLKINNAFKDNKWKMDASRRDFTINSMFLDLEGNVYDYFNGYKDLKKKKVVFVGEPIDRIREDYLRIFRYFRFQGSFAEHPNYLYNNEAISAIKETISGLSLIHGSRIWSEWKKILMGKYGCELTLKLIECGIAPYCGLPDHPNTEEFKIAYRDSISRGEIEPLELIYSLLRTQSDVSSIQKRLHISF